MQDVLENNILHFWQTKMVDHENGGFYGRIDGHEVLHPEAEKGAILNARILWTFSAAYRVMKKPEYLEMATYAKEYFIEHFLDKEYGGVYWSVDSKGQPLNTRKQFYAIGFAIYGLSEYVRATGDREALDYALHSSMTALRSMHWTVNKTAILRQRHATGSQSRICDSLS